MGSVILALRLGISMLSGEEAFLTLNFFKCFFSDCVANLISIVSLQVGRCQSRQLRLHTDAPTILLLFCKTGRTAGPNAMTMVQSSCTREELPCLSPIGLIACAS